MPHQINWVVEKRVLYTTFRGVITAGELKGFIAEVRELAQTGTPLVHHISNSLELERVEFSLKTAHSLVGALQMTHELGWQIDINLNPLNKMFANIISQFASVRTRTFPSFHEAVAFLKTNDVTLANAEWLLDGGQWDRTTS